MCYYHPFFATLGISPTWVNPETDLRIPTYTSRTMTSQGGIKASLQSTHHCPRRHARVRSTRPLPSAATYIHLATTPVLRRSLEQLLVVSFMGMDSVRGISWWVLRQDSQVLVGCCTPGRSPCRPKPDARPKCFKTSGPTVNFHVRPTASVALETWCRRCTKARAILVRWGSHGIEQERVVGSSIASVATESGKRGTRARRSTPREPRGDRSVSRSNIMAEPAAAALPQGEVPSVGSPRHRTWRRCSRATTSQE